VLAWLAAAELDAEIPIPIGHEVDRVAMPPLALGPMHQLVQVDPTPALEEAGEIDAAPDVLAAAAAGVLAGRIAAGNRRWRAALDP
jgi:hypothetical protein